MTDKEIAEAERTLLLIKNDWENECKQSPPYKYALNVFEEELKEHAYAIFHCLIRNALTDNIFYIECINKIIAFLGCKALDATGIGKEKTNE